MLVVPDSPESVNVSESFPTGIVLVVTPPLNDGGEKVKGYHVEYFEKPVDTNGRSLLAFLCYFEEILKWHLKEFILLNCNHYQ